MTISRFRRRLAEARARQVRSGDRLVVELTADDLLELREACPEFGLGREIQPGDELPFGCAILRIVPPIDLADSHAELERLAEQLRALAKNRNDIQPALRHIAAGLRRVSDQLRDYTARVEGGGG